MAVAMLVVYQTDGSCRSYYRYSPRLHLIVAVCSIGIS